MKVLVPVDGSVYSVKALQIAAELVKTKKANIYVLSVVPSIGGIEDHEISPSRRDRHMEVFEKRAEDAIKLAGDILSKEDVTSSRFSKSVVTSVSVPDAIIDFAETEKIDLIVIGSRGLSTSSRFKLGSIANQVVKYSPCSVYLVKMQAAQ